MANSTKQDLRAMLLRTPHIFKDAAGNRGGRFSKKRSQHDRGPGSPTFQEVNRNPKVILFFFSMQKYRCMHVLRGYGGLS